ncbi:MAG TPA: hypothetical protein VIK79_08170 [Xanthobacteraceae bacterium]|jgi:hypothetical protein
MNSRAEDCPVAEEFIGRLYRAPTHRISELVSELSELDRGSLAAFCYGRAHLREIGYAIAATCDLETLVSIGGRVGSFLFDLSRERPEEEKAPSHYKQAKVSLAQLSAF